MINPILLRTFRQPNKQSGSHFLNHRPDSPTIPIPTPLRCDFCGCINEANVAVAEYDRDNPETPFPTPFETENFAYVATANEQNPPDTPINIGILTPMRRVVTCGYARAIEALTTPVPIADDLPPLVPINVPDYTDGIENIILPTIAPSDTNDLTNPFAPIVPTNNASNAIPPPHHVPDTFATDPVDIPNFSAAPMHCNPISPVSAASDFMLPTNSIHTIPSKEFQQTIQIKYFSPDWFAGCRRLVQSLIPTDPDILAKQEEQAVKCFSILQQTSALSRY
jgi:hypothetical protein